MRIFINECLIKCKKPTPKTDALLGPSSKPPSQNPLKIKLVAVKKATVSAVSSSLTKLGIKKEQRPSPHSPPSTPSSALRNYSMNPSPASSRSSSRGRRSSSRRSSSRGSTKPPTPLSEKFSESSSSHRSRKESYSSSYSNSGRGSIQKIDIKGKSLKSKTIKKMSRSAMQRESKDSKPKESTGKSELENERSAGETKVSTKDTLEDLGSSDENITGTGTKDDSIKLLSTKAGKKPVSTKSMTHLNTNPEGTEFCSTLKSTIRYLSTKSLTRINTENEDIDLLPIQRKTDSESDDSDSEEKGKLLPSSSNKSNEDTNL
ncbi:uncharacterized protein LOC114335689 [Diabrotica virgifera virgifera]|uniref:Uncharacterized protein n=1 Tax=Diabrotica virgifera virgifera TaxID=50390 RepID=A0ABM5KLM6_DIAVI|nr:uncharacterized protein LOC114335689 [Diabrotica virgifera virgifera]